METIYICQYEIKFKAGTKEEKDHDAFYAYEYFQNNSDEIIFLSPLAERIYEIPANEAPVVHQRSGW